ncbi:beta-1,6-N-acetylglucosaminyltransferase [Limnofasciculus baicalensis]|uniref:Peptide O-xylosyltransferase n=1 Tax=Limnofasciculus baicalensis BBK-W-15 TaxID=2699891 RepID=A0AAE3KL44_9CYAN|nr:beta-1,6-N-acetylglucosaminyltransferase [Limnofasciculus baicalensis]MCP2727694.1 beta-1,6-N-acetylglucosaminyltransferase [Limnofasciculus baicalensis BBK-W-15]
MSAPIGFILLTHTKPHQIIRLVTRLNSMFDCPPIVCHHDFFQSDFPIDALSKNVLLVHPHIKTGWGNFSVVESTLRALRLMYQTPDSPDWFILLSGADYPIKPANQILDDLASRSYDVYIEHEPIKYNDYERDWQRKCYERYCTVKFQFSFPNINLRLTNGELTLKHPLLTRYFLPFSSKFRCFAGGQWFCANRKAAEYLIDFHTTKPSLASHYCQVEIPDESYYQTILCNNPHLKIKNNHWRYIDWSKEGKHPETLLFEDLPKLLASSAHFARKFDVDTDIRILDELDAIIG